MYQQQSPNYSYYNQMPSNMRVAHPSMKGWPVSSIDEARAASIDFDGSIFYFPDLANQRIYTKQINIDGTSTFKMYELKEMPPIAQPSNTYVTREEFEQLKAELLSTAAGKKKEKVDLQF